MNPSRAHAPTTAHAAGVAAGRLFVGCVCVRSPSSSVYIERGRKIKLEVDLRHCELTEVERLNECVGVSFLYAGGMLKARLFIVWRGGCLVYRGDMY